MKLLFQIGILLIQASVIYIERFFKALLIFSVRKQSCLYNNHDLPTSTVSYQLKGTSHRYQKRKETALNMLNLKDFRFCAVNRITTQKRQTFLCEKFWDWFFDMWCRIMRAI